MVKSADYVIIGGGSAGCVLAARLSEDPAISVVLLEAGGENDSFLVNMPAGTAKLMGHKDYDWCLPTEADPTIGERKMQWSAGKVLGGSSSINGQVYMRGERSDYDNWEKLGCAGWNWDTVFPYFVKSESLHDAPSQSHGTFGPLSVSPVREPQAIGQHVIDAFEQIGVPINNDYCDGRQFGVYRVYATQKDGRRCSVANAYLDPARSRANLTVITGAHVDHILVENSRATGVVYRNKGTVFQVGAGREVIVSAGTIHSPAILMRSGIGPAAHLQDHGIDVAVDLPGVGQNLREHNTISVAHLVSIPTMSAQLGPFRIVGHLINYLVRHKGLLTTPAVQVMAALKSEPDLPDPDLILSMLPVAVNFDDKGNAVVEQRGSFSLGFHVARPQSQGEIRLRSSNPGDKPVINHRLLSDGGDVAKLVKGLRIVERLCRAPALASIIIGPLKPDPFPDNDASLEDYVRKSGGIGYHCVGTCRMGPDSDPLAVLDSLLKVRGVAGLRVVDASVMPEPVSANTNAPTIMIAERAAEFIRSMQ